MAIVPLIPVSIHLPFLWSLEYVWPIYILRTRRPGGYRITMAKGRPFSGPSYTDIRKSAQVCTFPYALCYGCAILIRSIPVILYEISVGMWANSQLSSLDRWRLASRRRRSEYYKLTLLPKNLLFSFLCEYFMIISCDIKN